MTLADQCVKRACFLSIAKPGAIAPTPASRQGPWIPPVVGGNSIVCYAVCMAVSFDDHLFGTFDPHPMQNDRKLSRNRNFGFA
jgi:hypothetical protein